MSDITKPIHKRNQLITASDALIAEAWEALERTEIASGKQLSQDALDLSRSIEPPYIKGSAHSLIVLAEAARNEGQYGTAIAYIMEAELLYEDIVPDIWYARGLYIHGFSHEHLGNHSEALRIFHSQYDIANEIGNQTYKATALRRIGSLHSTRNRPDKALEYFEQCLSLYESAEDKTGLAGVYVNMSEIYCTQKNYEKALASARHSLSLHEAQNLIAPRAFSHSVLARIYFAMGDVESGEHHIAESLKFARQSGRNFPQVASLKAASIIRNQIQQNEQAVLYLKEALQLTIKADDRFEVSECHRLLAETYANLGQFKIAYEHQLFSHQIREELWNESNETRFETLEILYQTKQAQHDARLQHELRENDQKYFERISAIKDDVITTASHDLKNPLASLRLSIHVLKMHGNTKDARGQELIERINLIIEQMLDLIINILDLARFEMGQTFNTEVHDYIAFVRTAITSHKINAGAKNITLTLESNLKSQNLGFDAFPIQQVINNLVSNAIKYTRENGRVTIYITLEDKWLVTGIEDTGIGIPPDDLPNIFQRFYRVESESHRSIEGSGLGLAICKSIVEKHGGQISIESTPGQGSTFSFRLPIGNSQSE